jgi:hypothetical protein
VSREGYAEVFGGHLSYLLTSKLSELRKIACLVVRPAPEGGYSRDDYPAGIYTRADELPVR